MSKNNLPETKPTAAPLTAMAAALATAAATPEQATTATTTTAPLNNADDFITDTSTDAEQMSDGSSGDIALNADAADNKGPLGDYRSINFLPRLDAPQREQKDARTGVLMEKSRKVGEAFLELLHSPGVYLTCSITKFRKVGQVKAGIRASFVPFDFDRKVSPLMSDTDEGKASEKALKEAVIGRFLKWANENNIDLSKPQAAPVLHAIEGDDLV